MEGSTTSKFVDLPLTERVALIGLYAFLLFAWEGKGKAAIAFMLVLVPCLLDRRFWRDLRASQTAWVVALLLLYILVRGVVASINNPQYVHYHLNDGWRLMLLGGFVFVGWLLKGDQRRVLLALAIALLGFWIGRFEHFPWSEAFSGAQWWGTRVKLGLPSEEGFGLYSATASLGLVLLAPRIWAADGSTSRKSIIILVWGVFLLISVQGVIMSQTRSVWLSLTVVAFVLLLGNLHVWKRVGGLKSFVYLLGVTAVLVVLAYANQGAIKNRFYTEMDTTRELLSGNFDAIDTVDEQGRVKSIGVHYHLFLFALDHLKENPWFGLGPGISKPLIKEHWVASKTFHHVHNSYLEMMLRLGIVGTTLIFVMLALIVYGGWRAYREQRIDRDLFMFLVAALTLHLLVCFTDFRMLHTDWRYYWFLVGGALYSFSLLHPIVRVQRTIPPPHDGAKSETGNN